jgi:Amino-transferase class IV
MTNQLLQFSNEGFIEVPPSLDTKLAIADSWLVEDGRCRSLNLHFDRFRNWTAIQSPDSGSQLDVFFESVVNEIPLSGRWFPRIELHGEKPIGQQLHLRLREAPEQLGDAILWTYTEPDPREHSSVKGPDLSLGMQLRRRANMLGADEAVIVDNSGYICEGALSALVWWRGDVLCAPNHETPWLDSITRREVFAIAEQMGLQTRTERVKPADLVETEVWMLSSLQAIRPVIDWLELGGPLATPTHVEAFNKRLRLLSAAIR